MMSLSKTSKGIIVHGGRFRTKLAIQVMETSILFVHGDGGNSAVACACTGRQCMSPSPHFDESQQAAAAGNMLLQPRQ